MKAGRKYLIPILTHICVFVFLCFRKLVSTAQHRIILGTSVDIGNVCLQPMVRLHFESLGKFNYAGF